MGNIINILTSPGTVHCAIRMALDIASHIGEAEMFQPAG